MKKTILCALIGGMVFVLLFNILNLNIYISVAAALLAYIAMALILSNNIDKDFKFDIENIENAAIIIRKCSNYVRLIKRTAANINDKALSSEIYNICATLDKIINYIVENPQQARQIRKFMQYYLPVLLKILTKYDDIENEGLTGEDCKQLLKNISDIIKKMQPAFENKLNELYAGEVMDTDAEIKVLDTMLRSDGLIKNDDFIIDKKKVEL